MADDYFEDDPSKDAPAPDAKEGGDDDKQGDAPTFLINADVCPDMKPGESMELRVVAVHDKEYEVSYQPKDDKEEGEDAPPEEAPMPGASEGSPPGMMD